MSKKSSSAADAASEIASLLMASSSSSSEPSSSSTTSSIQSLAIGSDFVSIETNRILASCFGEIDARGNTPLHRLLSKNSLLNAGSHMDLFSVRELIRLRTFNNIQNNNGKTPLHIALSKGYDEIAILLIEENTNINIIDGFKNSPLKIAASKGNIDMVEFLIRKGADEKSLTSALITAYAERKLDIKNRLIHHAKFGANNSLGTKALEISIKEESIIDVLDLLKAGAKLDYRSNTKDTFLHLAVTKNNTDIARVLIDKGADINAKNLYENTPLHYAVQNKNKDMAKLLINSGANINAQNQVRQTPLHIAAVNLDTEMVELLLGFGPDLRIEYDGVNIIDLVKSMIENKTIKEEYFPKALRILDLLNDFKENIACGGGAAGGYEEHAGESELSVALSPELGGGASESKDIGIIGEAHAEGDISN